MIKLTDSLKLAYTKLRTRKIRLLVTVIVSALLFSILAAGSFVVQGVVASVESFSKEGFGDRYILNASNIIENNNVFSDPALIDRAIILQKQQIAAKKAEATRLGLDYDSTSEQPVYQEMQGSSGKERLLNYSHPIAGQVLKEYFAQHPSAGLPELQKVSQPYRPKVFHESISMSHGSSGDPTSGVLAVLKDGKEDFNTGAHGNYFDPFQKGLSSFTSSWTLMSPGLLEPFTFDTKVNLPKDPNIIPVVAPYTAAEQLLGLKPLSATASEKDKLRRIKEVRTKARSITFSACYRNVSSNELVQNAVAQQKELLQNAGNKQYKKPDLIYDVPSEACGIVRVVRDVRSRDQKVHDARQLQFDQDFGKPIPSQTKLNFQVIGIAPDPPGPQYGAISASGLFSSILSSSIGAGWYTPISYRDANPVIASLFGGSDSIEQSRLYYVELSNPRDLKHMIDKESCNPKNPSSPAEAQNFNPFSDCIMDGKKFILNPYGSSSVALDSVKKTFAKIFKIAALAVSFAAAVIMMGTLGRIIADSRRETAVFRAIGAKRLDIAQIYLTYILLLSALVAILAILIGYILARVLQSHYAGDMTARALIAFNAHDLTKHFNFYAWSLKDLMTIIGVVFAAGLGSASIPLLRNSRRNPIRDMRDEN